MRKKDGSFFLFGITGSSKFIAQEIVESVEEIKGWNISYIWNTIFIGVNYLRWRSAGFSFIKSDNLIAKKKKKKKKFV